MRAKIMTVCVVAMFAAAILTGTVSPKANASTGTIPLNCNRACLENVVEQYLTAVVAHDPKRLPLSKDVTYTENNQVLAIGDGFWKTAEARGNYTHIFADPEFGQVAYMGTMREAGAPLLMSLRLRIELGRITEIESIFFKPGGGGPNNIADMDSVFTLNETGAFIWELIDGNRSLKEIIDLLVKEYEIEYESAEQDVSAFVDNMSKYLIVMVK